MSDTAESSGNYVPNGLKYRSIKEVADETASYIDKRRKGEYQSLKTPWKKFNNACMGGIEWHTITTIAGMSGSGKTAIVNQLETGLFDLNKDQKFSVLSLNFEMLAFKLVGRKLSSRMSVTATELYSALEGKPFTDEQFKQAQEHLEKLKEYDIYYVDVPGTVDQLKKTIVSFCLRKQTTKLNPDGDPNHGVVVILDHMLLVNGKAGELERQTLFEVMTMQNELKKTLKVAFIDISQLNRDIESSERIQEPDLHFPRKKDIFAADSMYQFSDVVVISHRPEMLGIRYYGPRKEPTKDKIFWHFLKLREGEPFVAVMRNNLKHNEVLEEEVK